MGVKYYFDLLTRKFDTYEVIFNESGTVVTPQSLLDVVLEIACEDDTVTNIDFRELLTHYKHLVRRYCELVNLDKNED